MPWDRLARSQRSAVRVSVAVLALALGLTLAGSQATASTSTLAVSPSTVGNGANLTFSYSLIRIIEVRFGVMEPNISAWRRQTVGDFTSALNFSGRPSP